MILPLSFWIVLVSTIVLGIIVLCSYAIFLPKCCCEDGATTDLWGGLANPIVRSFYLVSILLAAISYLVMFTFALETSVSLKTEWIVGNILFLVGASLWPVFLCFSFPELSTTTTPSFLSSIKKAGVALSLCLTSLGAGLMVWGLHRQFPISSFSAATSNSSTVLEKVVWAFTLYLFFHVFFLDNIVWLVSYWVSSSSS